MINFSEISKSEYEKLLLFPVYVSLLAANASGNIDNKEKDSAIAYAHFKTYASNPELIDFYMDVDKTFAEQITQIDSNLPDEKDSREVEIKMHLNTLEQILAKLDNASRKIMHHSMASFKDHVSNVHHNVLVDFIFPVPINGISEG